jgi:glycosyltransferase involved in cell wall biosynthesis
MPNRGLDVALKLWPKIVGALPSAELWVTSGWELWGNVRAEAEEKWRNIVKFAENRKGVRIYRAVARTKLCELQQRALVSLYPCRFPEMFCLSAAECTAAGTPLVASANEALSERIIDGKTGILIEGSIEEPFVQARFVKETIALINDRQKWERFSLASRNLALNYDVRRIAQKWEELVG